MLKRDILIGRQQNMFCTQSHHNVTAIHFLGTTVLSMSRRHPRGNFLLPQERSQPRRKTWIGAA